MRTNPTLELNSMDTAAYWRQAIQAESSERARPLAVTRTREFLPKPVEREMTCLHDAYMMSLNLITMRDTTYVDGKRLPGLAAHAGSINIFHPGSRLRVIANGNADLCIMPLPLRQLWAVLEEAELGGGHPGEEILRRVNRVRDQGLLVLFRALADVGRISRPFDQLHADSLGMAIVCSLLSGYSNCADSVANLGEHGLSGRQLKRVEEFVLENISQPISLSCLAKVAGLSRMHFAAQFRRTTGMTPHHYVLQEKISCAQHTLVSSPSSLLQTALAFGFLSQSHFSTVFKRIVGDTPAKWRADCAMSTPTHFVGGYLAADAFPDSRN